MAQVTTARILAEKALQTTCGQQCVDWANGLLERGSDGDYVARLAGMLPPFNHFEVADLRDRALSDLGFKDFSPDDAVHTYAVELLRTALNGEMKLIEAIALVADLYNRYGFPEELCDFFLLYYAYVDLQTEDCQWYWNGATRDNIVSIIEERAQHFVAQSK